MLRYSTKKKGGGNLFYITVMYFCVKKYKIVYLISQTIRELHLFSIRLSFILMKVIFEMLHVLLGIS